MLVKTAFKLALEKAISEICRDRFFESVQRRNVRLPEIF